MAAMAAAGHRSVQFDAQPTGAYAVHLRLTPGLLEALLRAQESGESASIRFGAGPEGGAISVADASFPFRALEEHSSCDLLRVPASGASAQLLGALRQKLVVQRNVEEERSRVRARGEEAERRGHERTAKLLSSAKAAQAGKPGRQPAATTTQRRVTPPPGSGRALTPPPQQLTASMLAAPSGRPPTHPSAPAQAVQAAATAPAPAPAKPMHKSASTGKLGLASKGGTGSALPQKASARVLQAARAGVGLRLMLIAILAERPMSKDAIKAVLKDAAARVKSYKAPKPDDFMRTLKTVAEFRAPAVYVVYPVLLKELDSLPAAADPAEDRKRRSSTPPEQRGPSPKARKAGPGAAAAPAAAAAVRRAAGAKRARAADWTDDDSDADEQPAAAQRPRSQPPAAAPLVHAKAASEPALPLAAATSGASPPSVGGVPAGGSSGSGGAAAGVGGVRLTRRTSSSRGSELADESWIEEHADRQPEPAAPITSREEYRAREAAFAAKYSLYFELHQLIEAHKKDFEALDAAIRAASTEPERERHRAELERLHRKRGQRAKRWDAAYRVLHQELSAAKARMAEFVQRLQQQQQQQPLASDQRRGRSGTPPEALPTVRVQ